jgi:TonB family protein
MTRRTLPLVVLFGAALAVPALIAQSVPVPQAGGQAAKDAWPPAGVVRMNRGVQSPHLIKESKPQYTTAAREAGIQGIVAVEAIVNADGTVGEVRVVHSLDKQYGLDEAAVAAVKEWTFKPGRTKDGQAVPVLVDIELTFALRKG